MPRPLLAAIAVLPTILLLLSVIVAIISHNHTTIFINFCHRLLSLWVLFLFPSLLSGSVSEFCLSFPISLLVVNSPSTSSYTITAMHYHWILFVLQFCSLFFNFGWASLLVSHLILPSRTWEVVAFEISSSIFQVKTNMIFMEEMGSNSVFPFSSSPSLIRMCYGWIDANPIQSFF